jgi:hypothetical protein
MALPKLWYDRTRECTRPYAEIIVWRRVDKNFVQTMNDSELVRIK